MWSCLYITDRGAEEYESYGSIVDPQSGICDLCDRWIFGTASEFEPQNDGAKVEASVVSEGKGKKVIVYKYKRKTGYHKKNGHRQLFTQVKIDSIVG